MPFGNRIFYSNPLNILDIKIIADKFVFNTHFRGENAEILGPLPPLLPVLVPNKLTWELL